MFPPLYFRSLILLVLLSNFYPVSSSSPLRQNTRPTTRPKNSGLLKDAVAKTKKLIDEVIDQSFPELVGRTLRVRSFDSPSTFFKTRFSVTRFLTFRKTGFVFYVNPAVFEQGAPENGIRAIIAHEVAHADYYRLNGGFKAFGMVTLLDSDSLAKFERRADLTAIEKGYGKGLMEYREWLYRNVPSKYLEKKKRNYFSPEEIEMIVQAKAEYPHIIKHLMDRVPLTIAETRSAIKDL